jgi:hypothetical protein
MERIWNGARESLSCPGGIKAILIDQEFISSL